jgi:hypothetical protein
MQTFKLRNGATVTTERVENDIEFVTKTAEGGVISTVRLSFAESVPLVKALACCTL